MIKVKATREGLIGGTTSSGYIVDTHVPFVALPTYKALYKFVRLHNPLTGLKCIAVVLDVGPFNTDDDNYVFDGKRPKAEMGISISGKGTNKAGIDLSETVWKQLGMLDNTEVEWEFL